MEGVLEEVENKIERFVQRNGRRPTKVHLGSIKHHHFVNDKRVKRALVPVTRYTDMWNDLSIIRTYDNIDTVGVS